MRTLRLSSALVAIVCCFSGNAPAESYRDERNDDAAGHAGEETRQEEPTETGLTAGGLKPPTGDLDDSNRDDAMAKELARSDQADSGRGLEYFWLSGDVGIAFFDVAAGARGKILPGSEESGVGPAYGGGVGGRFLYFSAGLRFRTISLNAVDPWSLSLELGMKFPLGAFEPYARLGAGYLGVFRASSYGQPLSMEGFASRASGGFDYYFSDTFSLGAELGVDVASVSRAGLTALPNGVPSILGESVSSLALGCELMMNVGFHI